MHDRVRTILAIPDRDDEDGQERVAALLAHLSRTRESLPEVADVQRRLRSTLEITSDLTVAELLDLWQDSRRKRGRMTKQYETDIRVHLKPRIGRHRVRRLGVGHLIQMFDDIDEANLAIEANNAARKDLEATISVTVCRAARKVLKDQLRSMPPYRRVTGPTTQRNIRATLRAGLNWWLKQEPGNVNVAAFLDMGDSSPRKPMVWTKQRVERWQQTGEVPSPVMIWTPALTGQFLDSIADDPLHDLFEFMAYCGPRRGEACGAKWEGLRDEEKLLDITSQLVLDGWDVLEAPPKTENGVRTIGLDDIPLAGMRRRRARQNRERLRYGSEWKDTGYIYTEPDGSHLHPGKVSDHFERLVIESGLPPVRLHDLRHGAATYALAAGVDIKIVSENHGHASTAFTRDVYTSVLPELAVAAAEATAKIIPRQAS